MHNLNYNHISFITWDVVSSNLITQRISNFRTRDLKAIVIIGWSLSSSGLELDVAGHGCGVAVELGRLRGVSSSVPARGGDCVSQDPSHDGVDKSGVDKGDVVN